MLHLLVVFNPFHYFSNYETDADPSITAVRTAYGGVLRPILVDGESVVNLFQGFIHSCLEVNQIHVRGISYEPAIGYNTTASVQTCFVIPRIRRQKMLPVALLLLPTTRTTILMSIRWCIQISHYRKVLTMCCCHECWQGMVICITLGVTRIVALDVVSNIGDFETT